MRKVAHDNARRVTVTCKPIDHFETCPRRESVLVAFTLQTELLYRANGRSNVCCKAIFLNFFGRCVGEGFSFFVS